MPSKKSNKNILVIIPAYNEADSILGVAKSVITAGYDYIIINDGSQDSTLEVCRRNHLNVVDLSQNLGIGGAVQTGHKYAQRYGYDIDIQFDGDGQHDPAFIDSLVECIRKGADLSIGSRFLENTDGFKSTTIRRVGKTWLAACLRIFGHVSVTDPTSGFRACGSRAIDIFCQSYPIDYPEPESIAVGARCGLVINEIPVAMHGRQGGTSSITAIKSVYYMIKVSLAIIISCLTKRVHEE